MLLQDEHTHKWIDKLSLARAKGYKNSSLQLPLLFLSRQGDLLSQIGQAREGKDASVRIWLEKEEEAETTEFHKK